MKIYDGKDFRIGDEV